MKNRFRTLLLLPLIALAAPLCTSCGNNADVFHIMTWNEEWKNFFKKYVSDEGVALKSHWGDTDGDGKYIYAGPDASTFHLNKKTVKFTTISNENSAYQMALDRILKRNSYAARGDKIDMFLAESDYIKKYVNSRYTKDISEYNINMDNTYPYTVEAASDDKGHCKGVSFQCCPSGIIYRRSIAKAVFGNDGEPANVQSQINTWDKFNAAAAAAKSKGYMMTGSFSCTFRVYSSGVTKPWVDGNRKLQWDDKIVDWIKSTEDFIEKGYTQSSGIWEDATAAQMYIDGKTMCFDGPAWYYNFSMLNAQDEKRGCSGDWGIVQGPTPHFWGGTWLIAASGTDDDDLVKHVMDQFINDDDVCDSLIKVERQYVNNQTANGNAEGTGNDFLGGQDDIAFFNTMADDIEFKHKTIYDQDLNEGLQRRLQEHYVNPKQVSLTKAIQNFYCDIQIKYPKINIDTSYIPGIK